MKATYAPVFLVLSFVINTITAQNKIVVNYLNTEEPKHLFKINLSSALRSDYCISYEQKLNNALSAEITPGITRYNQFLESYDFFSYKPANYVFTKRKYNSSLSLKTALRYYIKQAEGNLTGAYLSAEAMCRQYNFTSFSSYTSDSGQKEKSIQKEIRILYGVQNRDYYDRFYYDCSIGAGYRFHQRDYLGYCGPTTHSEQALFYSSTNYIVFVINVKIGFVL